jgi:hypothetical protein
MSIIIKFKKCFLSFYLAFVSLIIIPTSLQAQAARICIRGLLPTEAEYTRAEEALKELNKELNHLMNIGEHRPGNAQFTPYVVQEAEKRKIRLSEKHITNLRNTQLPLHLKNCIESSYSYERLKELLDKWNTMASIYLENKDYPFNEKLILQLMINKSSR